MPLLRTTKRLIPVAISAILLAGVIWWVSPQALLAAAVELDWRLLLPATALMVVALYLVDAACLPVVYRLEGQRVTYLQAVHLRGLTYLIGALNYELGQAALAWSMARLQRTSLVRMLMRTVLLAYHDILVLLGVGLAGSLLTDDPRVERIRPIVAVALAVMVGLGVLFWRLPERVRALFRAADKHSFLEGWSLRRSALLLPLRMGYFAILIVYATVALWICQIPVDTEVVFSTIPIVMLADGLPNFAGLGTREASMHLLLSPDQRNPALVAMSLFWTSGMILGRFLIGAAHLLAHKRLNGSPLRDFAAGRAAEAEGPSL